MPCPMELPIAAEGEFPLESGDLEATDWTVRMGEV
jgi:hypothetical protein